ncbi:MAG: hypothetical protein FD167_4464 [bacterium]|nr:MAG: hypothetical protein FD167_4464 [bacterium]
MNQKNIRIAETITPQNVAVTSYDYKELLYELLENPEFEKEYLATALEETEYPQVAATVRRDIEEAKKRKEAAKEDGGKLKIVLVKPDEIN